MKINFNHIVSKICDCHVHYGQFREDYYNPEQLVEYYETIGIDKVGIMPVGTTWASDFNRDQKVMVSLPAKRFVPYLWVSPEMVDADPSLKLYDTLNYKVIKIHAYAIKEWDKLPDKIRTVIEVARSKNIPVMFHTGGWRGSNAIQFYKFCREYPEVTFILAHGKPISQTLTVLKGAKNAYTDSSFMANDSIKLICDAGLSHKILFGTDFPIMKTFWPEINLIEWYKNNVMELIQTFGEKNFMIWANENFYKLILKA
jgi:predicted TIM-barrel fold metal-dependent hydrolase